jgi:hypothetical protein
MAAKNDSDPQSQIVGLALIGLFLASMYVMAGSMLCRLPQEDHATEQTKKSDCRIYDGGNIFSCPELLFSLQNTEPGNEKAEAVKHKYGSWLNDFFCEAKISDIAIGLFTYCLVLVGYFQAHWLQKTVDATLTAASAAKEAAEYIPRVERAYLFLHDEIRDFHLALAPGQLSTVRIAFKNHGKTPAIIIELQMALQIRAATPIKNDLVAVEVTPVPVGQMVSGDGVFWQAPFQFRVTELSHIERQPLVASARC